VLDSTLVGGFPHVGCAPLRDCVPKARTLHGLLLQVPRRDRVNQVKKGYAGSQRQTAGAQTRLLQDHEAGGRRQVGRRVFNDAVAPLAVHLLSSTQNLSHDRNGKGKKLPKSESSSSRKSKRCLSKSSPARTSCSATLRRMSSSSRRPSNKRRSNA